jgi:hypothetical protein
VASESPDPERPPETTAPPSPPSRSRRRELALKLALAAVSTTVALVMAEFICRAFVSEVSDTLIVQLRTADEKFHHPLARPVDPPDPAAFRILFLGDSFTFTWGTCPPEYSFPALVQTLFREGKGPNGPRHVQSINLGTPSYSPSVYGVLLREFLPRLKPHLVVIAVDDSDPQDDYWYRKSLVVDSDGLPVSVYPHLAGVPTWLSPAARKVKLIRVVLGRLYPAIRDALNERGWGGEDEDEDEHAFAHRDNRYAHFRTEVSPSWQPRFDRTLGLLDAELSYCAKNGVPVALVNYPYAPAVTTRYALEWRKGFNLDADELYDPVFHALQRDLAASRGVPYYDFTDYLRRLPDLEGIYNEDDGHYSSLGNTHFAKELVRFLAPLVDAPRPVPPKP